MAGTYTERDPDGLQKYLYGELADGLTRLELIEAMEALLPFTKKAAYEWKDDFVALIYATVARSGRTFDGVCQLLRSGLAVQAAMLTRSLFEDMVVAHWLYFNHEDPDWLTEKFVRQREAIELHRRRVEQETGFSMPPMEVADDVKSREQGLIKEFGGQVKRDWWDPGRQGKGKGGDVGFRKLVNELEDVAAERKMFHPRFAGGEQPLLRRMDRVTHKWLSQCIHHTTIGLPFAPVGNGKMEISGDPLLIVGFNASWLYTQQIYLLFDIDRIDGPQLEAVWWNCMIAFARAFGQDAWVERLEDELARILERLEHS